MAMSLLLLLSFCALVAVVVVASPAAQPNKVRALQPAKYNEVIDLVMDAAALSCDALGERITAPNFDYRLRCDLFLEQVEDLSNMCDSMVKEIQLTQKQMVDHAIDGGYDRDLVVYMKRAVKGIFGSRRTSEREVSLELTKDMSQWILDVSVHEQGKPRKSSKVGAGAQMGRMTPAQREKLREMGVAMPDEDAIAGDAASGSSPSLVVVADEADKQWARETSRQLKKEKKQRGQRKAPPDPTEPPRSSDL